jgi:hypothetical protein
VIELRVAALAYARHGWPVFPVRARAKTPLTVHGLHDATTDPEQIRAWWTRWPDANIGVRTGDIFDVLDVDGDEGETEGARLFGDEDVELPPGPAALTPSGYVHLYFAPTGLGNRARFRPGLDWRGHGGYVVVPPSVGANGYPYRWWPLPDCWRDELVPAPAWLVALLERAPEERATADPGAASTAPARDRTKVDDPLAAIVRRVAAAPEGERNHLVFWAACELHALGHPETLIRDALHETCRDNGLPLDEADRAITSALSKPRKHR